MTNPDLARALRGTVLALGLVSGCYVKLDPACGDGIVNQPHEECDNGDDNAPDAGCTSQCTVATCGDGLVWTRHFPAGGAREACDNGADNADNAECLPTCELARCGDGLVWELPLVNGEPPEACDDGEGNADDAACTSACQLARCGDGLLGPGETCDDGNTRGGDGCGPTCIPGVELDIGAVGARYVGEEPADLAGSSVSSAGDVDGDTLDDLIIGAPGHDAKGSDAGAAYLLFGGATGPVDLAAAPIRLDGEAARDQAGVSVAAAGDFNGDGFGDVVIGAPLHDAGGMDAGAAYVVFGPVDQPASLADADLKLVGEGAGDWAGWSVAGAGDVDGDGFDDVLVGAPGDPAALRAGAVYVVRGGTIPSGTTIGLGDADAKIVGEADGDRLGFCLAGAGDLDGDGLDDLVVGSLLNDEAGEDSGAAYIVSGPVAGPVLLAAATAKLLPEGPGYRVSSVSGAGDVDGDGIGDVLVGSDHHDALGEATGKVYVMTGPLSGTLELASSEAEFVGQLDGSQAGHGVAGVGDVNRDGFDDLLIGAPGTRSGVGDGFGAAYLIFGPVSGSSGLELADVRLLGELPGDFAGRAVAAAGDVDGDGIPDLFVGAPGNDAGGTEPGPEGAAGAAYLIRGSALNAGPR